MGSAYKTLNQQTGFFENLRYTALDDPSRQRLISTQDDIYGVMCRLETVMKSNGQVPNMTVPGDNLPESFTSYSRSSRCEQQEFEYIIMLDSVKVLKQLRSFIRSLLTQNIQC